MTNQSSEAHLPPEGQVLRIFLMDAPNVDQAIAEIIGRKPSVNDRPRFPELYQWLSSRLEQGEELWPTIFVNKAMKQSAIVAQLRWLRAVNNYGFHTFLKYRHSADSDIDEEMLGYLRWFTQNRPVAEVILASNDRRRFYEDLKVIADSGIKVTILGFREMTSALTRDQRFTFIPWPEIPGVMHELQAAVQSTGE